MISAAATEVDEYDLPMGWAELPPGPQLAIELSLIEWSALSDRELVAAMDAARRQTTWTQSVMLEGIAELSARRTRQDPNGGSDTHRRICGEVSLELIIPAGQAEDWVAMADVLPTRLPRTWAAMRTGHIDYDRAMVMLDGTLGLDAELTRSLDAALSTTAAETTKTVLRRRLTRAIKKADPDAHAERTKTAREERRVEIWSNDDDTCDLIGRNLDATDAQAIRNRLTAAARAMKADGDSRSLDQIRLDLYRDLLRGIPLPEAVRLLIAEAADTTGNDDQAQPCPSGDSVPPPTPAEVIAEAERQIAGALAQAADEELIRLFDRARAEGRLDGLAQLVGEATRAMREALAPIVDAWCRARQTTRQNSTGDGPHDHGGYRPPAAMQRLIQRRHTTCVYPRCNRRSDRCDIDHTQPYDKGGRTCPCNLAPLCRAHHRLFKQHRQWQLIQLWPGLLIWVAPAGTWHIVLPQ